MLQLKSILNVIDNSGAVWAECIRVLHGGQYARIGTTNEENRPPRLPILPPILSLSHLVVSNKEREHIPPREGRLRNALRRTGKPKLS